MIAGTPSRLGGVTLEILAAEAIDRHRNTYRSAPDTLVLRDVGNYHWRAGGEKHINDPTSIAALQVFFNYHLERTPVTFYFVFQEAAVSKNKSAYEKFKEATMESVKNSMLRGRLEMRTLDQPLPLSEVESAANIVKRFATGAMSFGSISLEAHQTLAEAMNKVMELLIDISSLIIK